MSSPFSGPTPLYNNPPIQPQFYQPHSYDISNISLGSTTIVTTSVSNDYVIGQQVRLLIPLAYGSYQLNGSQSYVISLPAPDQVELSIDSRQNVNSFISSSFPTKAQIIAIGDINSGAINTSNNPESTFIPGSFINISPI